MREALTVSRLVKKMIKVGYDNTLKVLRDTSVGMFLGDEEEDILLPNKYIPDGLKVDDEIEVFVYRDSEDRLIATTLEPKIKCREFAYLQVKDVTNFGAFLDWGLEKDLMVPFKEQQKKMEEGRSYVVYLTLDEETDRLVATAKFNKYFITSLIMVQPGQEVDLLVYQETDLGYKVVVNGKHTGLIYKNEVFQKVAVGDELKGYVKNIREDKKLDISLQKQGYGNVEPNAQKILDYLSKKGGEMTLTDKSDPELIKSALGMSKKTFKKALGALYKEKVVVIESDKVSLV